MRLFQRNRLHLVPFLMWLMTLDTLFFLKPVFLGLFCDMSLKFHIFVSQINKARSCDVITHLYSLCLQTDNGIIRIASKTNDNKAYTNQQN